MTRLLMLLVPALLGGDALLSPAAAASPADATAPAYDILFNPLIKLPAEPDAHDLLASIDGFLGDMAASREATPYVDPEHFAANLLFFEGLQGYAASGRYQDDRFYKSHLLGVTPAGDGRYEVQISLMGQPEDGPAVLRMIFRMGAVRDGARFRFRCLREENARDWLRRTVGNIDYVYHGSFDEGRAREFDAFNTRIAGLLGMAAQTVTYVRCKDPREALAFLGIDYYVLTNGDTTLGLNDGFHFVTGLDEEGYEHDLLHIYFAETFDAEETYRPFEEGIATYYAGSWGESYTDVMMQLQAYVAANPDVDLLAACDERVKIGKHDLRFAINALLVEEIVRSRGFDAVVDALHCGAEGERYLEKLNQHLGISVDGFSGAVRERVARWGC